MKARLTDRWIYIIAVINAVAMILLVSYFTNFDSTSYIKAWDESWSKGIIDEFRTPVYPCFLGLMKLIAGKYFMTATIIAQYIIFIISIRYFQKTASWMIKSRTVVWWMTLLYAVLPSTSTWANCIITETFALTGIVFLFYNLLVYRHKINTPSVIWVTFWLAFLIFLRPACLYLIPAIAIAWILFLKDNKRNAIFGLMGIVLVGILELGYCAKFKERYGVFATSSVSTINGTYTALQYGLMDESYTDNPEYKKFIKEHNGTIIDVPSIVSYMEQYGLITMNNAVKEAKSSNIRDWCIIALKHFKEASSFTLIITGAGIITLTNLITIKHLYVFLFVYFVILLIKALKTRKLSKISIILWVTGIGNLLLVMIGAQNAWNRLLLPSLPLFMIMFGQAFNYIKFDLNGTTKETDIE